MESGESPETVQEEASQVLEEMAHRLQLSTIRFFALTLSKAFKALYRSVRVNEEGVQRVSPAPCALLTLYVLFIRFKSSLRSKIRSDGQNSVKRFWILTKHFHFSPYYR